MVDSDHQGSLPAESARARSSRPDTLQSSMSYRQASSRIKTEESIVAESFRSKSSSSPTCSASASLRPGVQHLPLAPSTHVATQYDGSAIKRALCKTTDPQQLAIAMSHGLQNQTVHYTSPPYSTAVMKPPKHPNAINHQPKITSPTIARSYPPPSFTGKPNVTHYTTGNPSISLQAPHRGAMQLMSQTAMAKPTTSYKTANHHFMSNTGLSPTSKDHVEKLRSLAAEQQPQQPFTKTTAKFGSSPLIKSPNNPFASTQTIPSFHPFSANLTPASPRAFQSHLFKAMNWSNTDAVGGRNLCTTCQNSTFLDPYAPPARSSNIIYDIYDECYDNVQYHPSQVTKPEEPEVWYPLAFFFTSTE